VGRLAGDEFAVILEGLRHVDGAASIAGHIVDRLREPFRLANSIVSISARSVSRYVRSTPRISIGF
jgi:GGDEF domain-containing protein